MENLYEKTQIKLFIQGGSFN